MRYAASTMISLSHCIYTRFSKELMRFIRYHAKFTSLPSSIEVEGKRPNVSANRSILLRNHIFSLYPQSIYVTIYFLGNGPTSLFNYE